MQEDDRKERDEKKPQKTSDMKPAEKPQYPRRDMIAGRDYETR